MIAIHHRLTSAALLGTALGACSAPADVAVGASTTTQEVVAVSSVASMATARGQHAAAVLSTGEVLVVGGVSRLGFVSTAERFDPVTGRWRAAASPGILGNVTQAVTLQNGGVLVITDGSTTARIYDPLTDTWSTTGPMATTRSLATMTVLASGRVLVAGGSNLATAELYDPASNTFSSTGAMADVRRGHAAVLLADGRVLGISGFSNATIEVPGAELYDPATGTWSPAAPVLVARYYGTATRLADGRVLLAGGVADGGVTGHAELYDPAANTWTATSALAAARNGHTAARLPDGTIVAIGGSDAGRNAQAVVERYDPATGTWSPLATLARGRENGTATMLSSGRLLVVGGYTSNPSLTFFPDVELLEPSLRRVTSTPSTSTARDAAAVRLEDGAVFVVGGEGIDGVGVDSAAIVGDDTRGVAPMTTVRAEPTATLLDDGDVLVVGGVVDTADAAALASTERYDVGSAQWTDSGTLAAARVRHTATRLRDGSVLVVGGEDGGTRHASVERFDPVTSTWTAASALSAPRTAHAAARLADGRVLVVGGLAAGSLSTAELFDPATQTWAPAASMARARVAPRLTLLPGGLVLVTGGVDGSFVAAAELYDPTTNTWSAAGTLLRSRAGHTATLLPSGEVVVAGGGSGDVEVFEPATRTWNVLATTTGTDGLAAARRPDGRVIFVGPQRVEHFATTSLSGQGPVVTGPATAFAGCPLTVTGERFDDAGGSASTYLDSGSSFPLVRLISTDDGVPRAAPTQAWSSTAATIDVPADLVGAFDVVVEVNGVADGRPLQILPNRAPQTSDKSVTGAIDEPLQIVVDVDNEPGQDLTLTVVTPPAHGTLSGALPDVVYTPDEGFLGDDSFVFSVSDCGLSAQATVSIEIVDPPPTIACPDDVTVEATSSDGAIASWGEAVVVDNDVAITPTYAPERDTLFALGSTTVTATAVDGSDVEVSCVFQVVVSDTTAPTISCPEDITVEAVDDEGIVVTFAAPVAEDAVTAAPNVVVTPASGSVFAVGTTEVTARATDVGGNGSTCTFDVVVAAPVEPEEPEPEEPEEPEGPDTTVDEGCDCTSTSNGAVFGLGLLGLLRRRRR